MPTPKVRAMFMVASACSVQSPQIVKVVTSPSFDIIPNDLFLRSYDSVGIVSDADISSYIQILLHLVPPVIRDDVGNDLTSLPTTPATLVGDAVDIVENQILNHGA